MKTTKFFIGLLFFTMSSLAMAEKSPVLMTIDGHDVTKAEFEYIYHKNNTNNAVDKKTLDEYVELFKNFTNTGTRLFRHECPLSWRKQNVGRN